MVDGWKFVTLRDLNREDGETKWKTALFAHVSPPAADVHGAPATCMVLLWLGMSNPPESGTVIRDPISSLLFVAFLEIEFGIQKQGGRLLYSPT
jgi:hypothetical protein